MIERVERKQMETSILVVLTLILVVLAIPVTIVNLRKLVRWLNTRTDDQS